MEYLTTTIKLLKISKHAMLPKEQASVTTLSWVSKPPIPEEIKSILLNESSDKGNTLVYFNPRGYRRARFVEHE